MNEAPLQTTPQPDVADTTRNIRLYAATLSREELLVLVSELTVQIERYAGMIDKHCAVTKAVAEAITR